MIWIKLPEMEIGTERAHWFAYCWNCQREAFMPGMFLQSQLYFNPFIHTELICEQCARTCDPRFGEGATLELIDGVIHITKGDERECEHDGKKSYYPTLPESEVILACSCSCADSMVTH